MVIVHARRAAARQDRTLTIDPLTGLRPIRAYAGRNSRSPRRKADACLLRVASVLSSRARHGIATIVLPGGKEGHVRGPKDYNQRVAHPANTGRRPLLAE